MAEKTPPQTALCCPSKVDGLTVYFANLRNTGKTAEIQANPKTEICFLDRQHNQVRLTGVAEVVDDKQLLAEIWAENPIMPKHLGDVDNPDIILYRIKPERVIFMQEWSDTYHEVPLD